MSIFVYCLLDVPLVLEVVLSVKTLKIEGCCKIKSVDFRVL